MVVYTFRPQPGAAAPGGRTAWADRTGSTWVFAGRRAGDVCAPGRGRTDTGDPFRGPASSFGLRGLGNDTPADPHNSRPANGVEKDPLRCIYSIPRSPVNAQCHNPTLPPEDRVQRVTTAESAELARWLSRQAGPASIDARRKTASSIAGVTRPVNVFCWLGW